MGCMKLGNRLRERIGDVLRGCRILGLMGGMSWVERRSVRLLWRFLRRLLNSDVGVVMSINVAYRVDIDFTMV